MIVEECAQVSTKFFLEVVGPILGMETTALVAISTIKSSENWYTQFLELKGPSGRPLMNTYKFFLSCDDCIDRGVAASCTHKYHELPSWIGAEKQEILRSMYKQLGAVKILEQETIGLAGNSAEAAFKQQIIRKLFNAARTPLYRALDFETEPAIVFVSMDPNLGGAGSDFALCSCAFSRGTMVIVGLESIPAQCEDDYKQFVVEHLLTLRSKPPLQEALFVLACESNLLYPAQNIAKYCLAYVSNVYIMSKDGLDTSNVQVGRAGMGVHTHHSIKAGMYQSMKDALESDSVRFFENMTVVYQNPNEGVDFDRVKDIKQQLKSQLLNYLVEKKIPQLEQAAFAKIAVTYSGKRSGRDDLAMVLQLAHYWYRYFCNHPKYAGVYKGVNTV